MYRIKVKCQRFLASCIPLLLVTFCCWTNGLSAQAQTMSHFKELVSENKTEEAVKYVERLWPRLRRSFDDKTEVLNFLIENHRIDEAEHYLESLKKQFSRVKDHEEALQHYDLLLDRSRRALHGTNRIFLLDTLTVSLDGLENILRKLTPEQGVSSRSRFVSMDGFRSWEIKKNEQTGENEFIMTIRPKDFKSYNVVMKGLPKHGDIAFPYVMADGVRLYYAYKDTVPGSSYDLFVTRFDNEQQSYLKSQKMPLPFNGPLDDLVYVLDEDNDIALFASDRRLNNIDSLVTELKHYRVYLFRPSQTQYGSSELSTDSLAALASLSGPLQWADQRVALSTFYAADSQEEQLASSETPILFRSPDGTPIRLGKGAYSSDEMAVLRQYARYSDDLKKITSDLSEMRKRYAASGVSEKNKLKERILFLEERQQNLQSMLKDLKYSFLRYKK